LGQSGIRNREEDTFRLDAEEFDLLDPLQTVQLAPDVAGDPSHLLQRKTVTPQGDRCDRRQPELVVDERTNGTRRELRRHVLHLVAERLPDPLDVGAANPIVYLRVDDRHSLLGRRPDVFDLADLSDLFFQLTGDQVFDLINVHTRMQSRNNGLANFDGGIFLARIIEEDEEADQWNTDQDQNGNPVGVDGEFGDFSEHCVRSIRLAAPNRSKVMP
jgi:hypothetical protein